MTDARFEACLPFILHVESGNDDDPQDHGGRTSRGITQREYSVWRIKWGVPDRDVWLAADSEVHDIYYREYWLPRGPKLHPGVDLVYFNFAVNAGPEEAHNLLMRSVGPDDVDDDLQTINRMCNEGEAFYRGLAQFPRYGRGWTSRTEYIRAAARHMKEASMVTQPPATQGRIMIDATTIVNDANIALSIIEKLLPFVNMFNPTVGGFLTAAVASVRTIETQIGIPTTAALAQATSHVTPGQPNSPALS